MKPFTSVYPGGPVGLRSALLVLPDDAATRSAVHEVVAFLNAHVGEQIDLHRLARATSIDTDVASRVVDALAVAHVLDCDGDPRLTGFTLSADPVLSLEIRRFLRSGDGQDRLHRGIDRYRGRFGSDL